MKRALKVLGDLPWFAVLLPSMAIFGATSYYAFSTGLPHLPPAPEPQGGSVATQIGELSAQLGQLVATEDGSGTTVVFSGGDNPKIQISSAPASGETTAMLGKKSVSEEELAAAGIITEETIDDTQASDTSVRTASQPQADANRDLEVAIAGGLRNVVQSAVAGYRVRSNLLLIGFVTLLLGLLIAAKAMMARQRGAEMRLAFASSEAERARLNAEMSTAQLAMMQAQIEPHFLFNTMASVQHLIETDPAQAAALQKNLTQYLRAAIPQMRETASTLGREIELARAYLGILKARMAERLAFTIDVPRELEAMEFPPMVIMTLLENAIKHGLEPKPEGGHIAISAINSNDVVKIEVTDTGAGFMPGANSGVGLANIRERLRLLYGGRASFVISSNEPAGTRAMVEIPS
jgi:signal transduction histidine kinase